MLREIFEETGLSVNEKDIINMNMRGRHKTFFCVMLSGDDVTLSDEHFEYGFFTLEEAMELDNLSKEYKKAVYECLSDGVQSSVAPDFKNTVSRVWAPAEN